MPGGLVHLHGNNVSSSLSTPTIILWDKRMCQTHLGPRPGDCYADIVFSFLWARLLRFLGHWLLVIEKAFILEISAAEEACPYLGPTWMDDSCTCLSADDPWSPERAACNHRHEPTAAQV